MRRLGTSWISSFVTARTWNRGNGGTMRRYEDKREELSRILLANIKRDYAALQHLLDRVNQKYVYEDGLYRFYHGSFKVYHLQDATEEMFQALKRIAPEGQGFCEAFQTIIDAGTGKQFTLEVNKEWMRHTAPIVQAFVHARYFVEMAVKYGQEFQEVPQPMPSGLAALLCLYEIR